jgi:hypothetical protein
MSLRGLGVMRRLFMIALTRFFCCLAMMLGGLVMMLCGLFVVFLWHSAYLRMNDTYRMQWTCQVYAGTFPCFSRSQKRCCFTALIKRGGETRPVPATTTPSFGSRVKK